MIINGHLIIQNYFTMKSKRKNPIKAKKQQLIDKINQCKTLKELKGIERTLSYYPVLKENYEWDYSFLLELIEFKLKRMREYFWTHNIVENEKLKGDICDKLLNILNAGYNTDIIESKDLGKIYVNTRNINRFLRVEEIAFLKNETLKDKYYLATVRECKAKALFWKYLNNYIEILWD